MRVAGVDGLQGCVEHVRSRDACLLLVPKSCQTTRNFWAFGTRSSTPRRRQGGVMTAVTRRESPGSAALAYHGRHCAHCTAVMRAGQPLNRLCVRGQIFATAALLARASRRAP
jgi:hypothetical protein